MVLILLGACALILLRYVFLRAGLTRLRRIPGFQAANTPYIYGGLLLAALIYLLGIAGWRQVVGKRRQGKGLVQPLLIVFIVLGSIYGGVTGITEAAAIGSIAVLLLILLRGEFFIRFVV
ncbi:MAG: hypothetical protein R3E89_18950 [Thiolinea sp.]